jgi:hypothetical protein
MEEMQALFEERLGRYQATIALEASDRMPIGAAGSNYFAEVYAGYTNQEVIYDSNKWMEAEIKFIKDFPEIDVLRSGRIWAPLFDAVDFKLYKIPGRDLMPKVQFQFVESERMKEDEYDLLINNPVQFMTERYLPRALGVLSEPGSARSITGLVKGGIAFAMMVQIMRQRAIRLQSEFGMPQPMGGVMLAPFDMLADGLRGLRGIMIDIRRRPEKIIEACEALIHDSVNNALALADPLKRYPIFMPFHRGCHPFLSPKQFETFYWPSLKKAMLELINAGYKIRAYLEGDWGPNWHHLLELPKGSVLCDIDNQGDIFQAKKDIGHHFCLAGGMSDSLLILGNPEEVKQRVKLLCDTVGKDGGFIINGGCGIPYDTKPENFRTMIDAIKEYGHYSDSIKAKVKTAPHASRGIVSPTMVTPWESKLAELESIMGDEQIIKEPWEMLEKMAYSWMWLWTW